jgi:hypothetical protein
VLYFQQCPCTRTQIVEEVCVRLCYPNTERSIRDRSKASKRNRLSSRTLVYSLAFSHFRVHHNYLSMVQKCRLLLYQLNNERTYCEIQDTASERNCSNFSACLKATTLPPDQISNDLKISLSDFDCRGYLPIKSPNVSHQM